MTITSRVSQLVRSGDLATEPSERAFFRRLGVAFSVLSARSAISSARCSAQPNSAGALLVAWCSSWPTAPGRIGDADAEQGQHGRDLDREAEGHRVHLRAGLADQAEHHLRREQHREQRRRDLEGADEERGHGMRQRAGGGGGVDRLGRGERREEAAGEDDVAVAGEQQRHRDHLVQRGGRGRLVERQRVELRRQGQPAEQADEAAGRLRRTEDQHDQEAEDQAGDDLQPDPGDQLRPGRARRSVRPSRPLPVRDPRPGRPWPWPGSPCWRTAAPGRSTPRRGRTPG